MVDVMQTHILYAILKRSAYNPRAIFLSVLLVNYELSGQKQNKTKNPGNTRFRLNIIFGLFRKEVAFVLE